jgi:hypothetical protein
MNDVQAFVGNAHGDIDRVRAAPRNPSARTGSHCARTRASGC